MGTENRTLVLVNGADGGGPGISVLLNRGAATFLDVKVSSPHNPVNFYYFCFLSQSSRDVALSGSSCLLCNAVFSAGICEVAID
jgi:hypothetical protein